MSLFDWRRFRLVKARVVIPPTHKESLSVINDARFDRSISTFFFAVDISEALRSEVEEVVVESVDRELVIVVFDENVIALGDHFVEDGGSVTRGPSTIGEDEHFWRMVLFAELDVFVLRLVIIEEDLRDEFRYSCVPDIFDTFF
jgi:hypothetical protein